MSGWGDLIGYGRDIGVLASVATAAVFWVDRMRNRPRVVVHSFSEHESTNTPWRVLLEVENVGTANTSLEPVVRLTALSFFGESIEGTCTIDRAASRTLKPHEPVKFSAELQEVRTVGRDDKLDMVRLWQSSHRTYRFRLTRGRTLRVRKLEWDQPPAGRVRFALSKARKRLKVKRMFKRLQTACLPPALPDTTETERGGE